MVLDLVADERRVLERLAQQRAGEVRHAEVAHASVLAASSIAPSVSASGTRRLCQWMSSRSMYSVRRSRSDCSTWSCTPTALSSVYQSFVVRKISSRLRPESCSPWPTCASLP